MYSHNYSFVCPECGETVTVTPRYYVSEAVFHPGTRTDCQCTRNEVQKLSEEMRAIFERLCNKDKSAD
jgi:hypothetical protein